MAPPVVVKPSSNRDPGRIRRRFGAARCGRALSRARAKLHGGGLELDSTPGQGTSVTVTLPQNRLIEA